MREGQMVKRGRPAVPHRPRALTGSQIAEAERRDRHRPVLNVTALSNASELTGADIAAAREDIGFAQATLDRQQALWQAFTTKADYEAGAARGRAGPRAAAARRS